MSKVNTGEGVTFLLAVACILVGALLAAVFAPAGLVAALAVAFLAAFGRHARPRKPADIRAKCTPFAEMNFAPDRNAGANPYRQGRGAPRQLPSCGGTTNGSGLTPRDERHVR
jgi:hypothetical protein